MNRVIIAGLLPLLLLAGCVESAYRAGAPVAERDHPPARVPGRIVSPPSPQKPAPRPQQASDDQQVQIAVYTPPPRFKAKPVTSAAVSDLVSKAERQKNAGNTAAAAATLERALRIEPRNAHLWNRLAQLRLAQGQYRQAENLASKSNALAAADRDLRRDNWLLIARARRGAGNLPGARLAERRAGSPR